MGAEVASRISLSEALLSPKGSMMVGGDDDKNDTYCSTITSATKGIPSVDTEKSSYAQFRNESNNDPTLEYDSTTSKQKKSNEQRSKWHEILFVNNVVTFFLIPAALIISYTFLGRVYLPPSVDMLGSFDINTITSFMSILASDTTNWYMMVLEEYAVFTKAMTTGIIQFFGDYAAQHYELQREKETKTIGSEKGYDLRRGLSLFADGLLLSGPLLHYCFEWMEDVWPTESEDGTKKPIAVLCHVFVNDYIIDSIYIGLSFVFTGFVEGYSLNQVVDIFRKDYGATVRASWLTSVGLIPVEMFCFGYLSLSFRVLAMNFVDLLWGAIISFYSHRSRRENLV